MSTIKSSDEHLTLNADGSSKDIKFQANGVEKASIDSSGNLTVSGNLTSLGIDDNADATAITIDSSENVIIGASSFDQGGFSSSATGINVHGVSPLVLCKETDTNIRGYVGVAGGDMYVITPDSTNLYIGTNDAARMTIDSTGAVTMTSQPCVNARAIATDIPINTLTVITLDNERFDIGSNLASNTFTAPVTGKYLYTYTIYYSNVDTASTSLGVQTVTSNRTYEQWITPDHIANSDFNYTMTSSQVADMDANDTLQFKAYCAGGAAQTDVHADSHISIALIA